MPQLPGSDLSRASGYDLQKGTPVNNTLNLQQKIAVVAEMNTANQSTPITPVKITSRAQAAALYGWGSPMDIKMRILFGQKSLDGIEVWAFPVAIGSGNANQQVIAVSGTASANVTHTLLIAGRPGLESGNYQLNITNEMTSAQVATLIQNTVNGVLGCPMAAAPATGIATSIIHSGSAGSGIAANDLFTVNNVTTGAVLATGKVLTVSGGAVATYTILTPGFGYAVGTNVATTFTLGTGSGFAIDISTLTTNSASLLANWKGATSEDITVNVLPYAYGSPASYNAAGLSYAITEIAAGTGTPNLTATLAKFQNTWFTIVDSGWGILNTVTNAYYITANGNANTQSGRYDPLVFKPAIYVVGNVTDSTTSSADTIITEALLNEMTIAVASEPLSLGLPMEAASSYAVNLALIANNTPNIDIQDIPLPDSVDIIPGGANPAQSANYTLRNTLMQSGMTTVIYNNGIYRPQDFVTTYAPLGEYPPAFRYPSDLMKDFNIKFRFDNIRNNVIGNKQIANDNDIVTVPNVVKPKDIVAALTGLANDLVAEGFITNAKKMINSISVVINASNVDRFDISFGYDRSGVARVVSNVATANP